MRFIVFSCFLFLMAAMALPASAQFSSGNNSPAMAAPKFGQQNEQLKTILALQDQLQILHRLIDHEKAVNNMVSAAVDINIKDPTIPSPDRLLCASIPANIPCAQAYNDLYENYSVAEKKPEVMAPILAKITNEVPKIIGKVKNEIAKQEPEKIQYATIYWTDITCLAGKCSAIISNDPKNPKARYRVGVGETLPDGSVISAISAAGMTLMRDHKPVQLDPAPLAPQV